MKLGLSIGYGGASIRLPVERVQLAERLGYDAVWTAETYGADAVTPLAFLAGQTKRIRLGTGIMQLAARTPANAAMMAMTVDELAGGNRFIAGIGMSGPQIVEGWYGQPWGRPYYRLRDYVTIMRKIFRREGPVTHAGKEIALPYNGPGSSGISKPLKSVLHGNPAIPIFLGTGTEANVKLTAELCDGWLGLHLVPKTLPKYRSWLEEGFRRAGNGKSFKDFEITAGVTVSITDDVRTGLERQKPHIALYVGGMGARGKNYHLDAMVERGYGDAALRIQELFLGGRKDEAAATVPDDYVDEDCLIGPPERIRERFRAWADSGITSLNISTSQDEALELLANVAETARLGSVRA